MPPFAIDPEKDTVCDVIRRWADARPHAPVFLDESRGPLTYPELVRIMERIGQTLYASGLAPGDRVAVVHCEGFELVSLILGVMDYAAAVPVGPRATAEEIAAVIRDCHVNAVLVEASLDTAAREVAAASGLPVIEAQGSRDGAPGSVELATSPVRGVLGAIAARRLRPGASRSCRPNTNASSETQKPILRP
jgi:acyl-CoA synthetase (AMP-forming)/AMP-acid ligase II